MYLEKDHFSRPFERKRFRLLSPKVIYPLGAVGVLLVVVFIALKFPGLNPLARNASSKIQGAIKTAPPSSSVPASPPREKRHSPPPSPAAPAVEVRGQIAPEVSGLSINPHGEFKIKKVIVVKKGDTLSSMCLENYGWFDLTLLDCLLHLNPEITDPNLILPQQKIKLPDATEQSLLVPASGHTLRVYLGTFRDRDEAQAFREHPALKGKEIKTIARRILREGTWYRLEAGDFSSEEEALKAIRILKKEGLLPLLTQ